MALFKCKMCGGALEIAAGESVVTCEYCGTQQTLPKLDDDKRANMYDRANHFRRNNEFDKAMGIYEQILNEDNTDAEAYWSLVLCRYGIEYVEDPASHKRIPTVNRAQFTSIFDDDNYKSALQYADSYQRSIYEAEAKAINEIQKGILAISQKEEPFDVFICYKESDNTGRRTPDSVLANDLYHQLTQEGFKVFFARITLEDKLGSAYEPYIFAALNSSKVMVVLGTKPEYFNAVWVKNEWSRYLALIKNGAKKMLIPAYKDMDPYDLPEEFSHLQAQDMGKLGFMQDLIRGIKKITAVEEPKTTVVKETVIASGNANTAPLLERAFMFLEDGDWNSANEYCEKVLDIDPKCAEAYVGKLMAELWVHKQEDLKLQPKPFDDQNNYQKAIRFADDSLKNTLIGYIDHINTRNENTRLENLYTESSRTRDAAKTEKDYQNAAQRFEEITGYKDAAVQAKQCLEQAEIARKDAILNQGKSLMESTIGKKIRNYESAIPLFESIPGWKDADEQIPVCQKAIAELQEQEKADQIAAAAHAKKTKKIAIIVGPIVAVAIAFVILLTSVIIPNSKYNAAVALMEAEQYEEAITAFEAMDGYKDSAAMIDACHTASQYNKAIALMEAGDYVAAYEALIALDGYQDSAEKAESIYEEYQFEKLKTAKVGDYVVFGSYEQDNDTANGAEPIEWLVLATEDNRALVISRYGLDCLGDNSDSGDITWETSIKRTWLNDTFFNAAFTEKEQSIITKATIPADPNPYGSGLVAYIGHTDPGNATQDRLFLLSISEAELYFSSDSARMCYATDFVASNGAWVSDKNGRCCWWLRTPGRSQDYTIFVTSNGYIEPEGATSGQTDSGFINDNVAIRPAMWIDLSALDS